MRPLGVFVDEYTQRVEKELLWAKQVRLYETFFGLLKPEKTTPVPNRANRRKAARKKG